MKMANGGFNPSPQRQFVTDANSRIILSVRFPNNGSDGRSTYHPDRSQDIHESIPSPIPLII